METLQILRSYKQLYFTKWTDVPLGLGSLPIILIALIGTILSDLPWWFLILLFICISWY